MLRERNPELKGFLEELLLHFLVAKPNTDTANSRGVCVFPTSADPNQEDPGAAGKIGR